MLTQQNIQRAGKYTTTMMIVAVLGWSIGQEVLILGKAVTEPVSFEHIFQPKSEELSGAAELLTLNQLIPTSEQLVYFLKDPGHLSPVVLSRMTDYFRKVTEYRPSDASGWMALGVCYYYSEQRAKAESTLRQAEALNPHFFWIHYNLGLLAYEKGRWQEALEHFGRAIQTRPSVNLQIIITSKVYVDIVRSARVDFKEGKSRLQEGYKKVQVYIRDCHLRLNVKPSQLPAAMGVAPQVF